MAGFPPNLNIWFDLYAASLETLLAGKGQDHPISVILLFYFFAPGTTWLQLFLEGKIVLHLSQLDPLLFPSKLLTSFVSL